MNSLLTALAVLSHPQLDGEMAFTLESWQEVLGIKRRLEGEDTGLKTYLEGCKSFVTRAHFGVCLFFIYNIIYVQIYDIIYINVHILFTYLLSMYMHNISMLHVVPEVSQKC